MSTGATGSRYDPAITVRIKELLPRRQSYIIASRP